MWTVAGPNVTLLPTRPLPLPLARPPARASASAAAATAQRLPHPLCRLAAGGRRRAAPAPARAGIDLDSLGLEIPDLGDDVRAHQEALGATFNVRKQQCVGV